MKIYAPDYYGKFKCIAGKCRHSCCIGWEIDIDEQTLIRYRNTSGDFGIWLHNSITQSNGTYHFELCENERCPFLNSANLCDIILNMGEDALCQICSDHPRFRNYFSGRTEIGLGLCCEAAAELILANEEKVTMSLINDDTSDELSEEDEYFINLRQKYIDILQQRDIPLKERFDKLLAEAEAKSDTKSVTEWAEIYLSLEHLDSKWVEMLKNLENAPEIHLSLNPEWELPLEQLAVYFILRHLADGRFDMSIPERVSFAVHAAEFVSTLASNCAEECGFELMIDTARMYSSEIEYSEENLEAILDICAEYNYEG